METWPTKFPAILLAGFKQEQADNIARTEMDAGTARQRQRFSNPPLMFEASFIMTQTQYQLFQAWFQYKIDNGAAWFNMNLKVGRGNVQHEVRFKKAYKATALSDQTWSVTAEMEARTLSLITETALDTALRA